MGDIDETWGIVALQEVVVPVVDQCAVQQFTIDGHAVFIGEVFSTGCCLLAVNKAVFDEATLVSTEWGQCFSMMSMLWRGECYVLASVYLPCTSHNIVTYTAQAEALCLQLRLACVQVSNLCGRSG